MDDFQLFVGLFVLVVCVNQMLSVDPGAPATRGDPLSRARQFVIERDWSSAIEELERVDMTLSTEWNGLMGHCLLRRGSPVDLLRAERHCDKALGLDPSLARRPF